MIAINLVPPEILTARRRLRRIRGWTVICAIVAAGSAVPVVVNLQRQARVTALNRGKEALTEELSTTRKALAELTHSLAVLNDRIDRAEALRTKRPWAALMSAITRMMPDEVWLTSFDTGAPAGGAAVAERSPSPNSAPERGAVVVMDGATRLVLAGYAVGHDELYEFMARLKESGMFSHVELVKAGKEPVLRSQAVHFELTCSWQRSKP